MKTVTQCLDAFSDERRGAHISFASAEFAAASTLIPLVWVPT